MRKYSPVIGAAGAMPGSSFKLHGYKRSTRREDRGFFHAKNRGAMLGEWPKGTQSIITDDYSRCFVEGCPCLSLQEHHLIEGRGRRSLSEQYGLKVMLCHEHHSWCHEYAYRHRVFADSMHMLGQLAFEKVWGTREDFRRIFGEYYVNDEGL